MQYLYLKMKSKEKGGIRGRNIWLNSEHSVVLVAVEIESKRSVVRLFG